jgi:preprotein translocase subunit SecE
MTTQVEGSAGNGLEIVKWLVVVVLLVAATLGNHYLTDIAVVWRWVGVVVVALLALILALTTAKGRGFIELLKEARIEARKVVWPTRQETWQTTVIVGAVVIVTSLMLWGIDSLFGWAVSAIIG